MLKMAGEWMRPCRLNPDLMRTWSVAIWCSESNMFTRKHKLSHTHKWQIICRNHDCWITIWFWVVIPPNQHNQLLATRGIRPTCRTQIYMHISYAKKECSTTLQNWRPFFTVTWDPEQWCAPMRQCTWTVMQYSQSTLTCFQFCIDS